MIDFLTKFEILSNTYTVDDQKLKMPNINEIESVFL